MAPLDTAQVDEMFDILTHLHRRYALYHLTNESAVVSISSLATAIATGTNHLVTDQSTGPLAIEITLRHVHLPKLVDAGFVSTADNSDTVELENVSEVSQFLDRTASLDGYTQPSAGD